MEEDAYGERDSQSVAFSTSPSLSWWMMKSLWHARLSVPDTFLLEDGHLVQWYFTSAASGKVLRRATKRLMWEDLSNFFSRVPRATWVGNGKNSWRAGVIATARRLKSGRTYPVMLTAADLKSLREKHNAHLLEEIVAIQPYVAKQPFVGCGVFETEFERKGKRRIASQTVLTTYELDQWPQENLTWFEDIEPRPDSSHPQSRNFLRRNAETVSSKRVHGVVHRMLATTTKAVVAHVEEKTGGVILRVVAQYAFRPSSGQPTLLWLDLVTIQRHEQLPQQSTREGDGSETLTSHAPADLVHGLREEIDRPWSTFFPPKLSELASGGSAASLAGRPVSLCRQGGPSQKIVCSLYGGSSRPVSKTLHASGPTLLATEMPLQAETISLEHGLVPDSEAPWDAPDDHQSGWMGDGIVDHALGRDGGQRKHFSLPTESWANRSSRRRGLYYSGHGERPSKKRLPRRRSTGTTMRGDGRRPDLRPASQPQRPWTAPSRVGDGTEDDAAGTGLARVGEAIGRRFASRASRCFGDYCHYSDTIPPTGESTDARAAGGNQVNDGESLRRVLASKMVPYRSVLDCRAEEKAMSLRREESEGCGDRVISGGFIPSDGADRDTRSPKGKTTSVTPSLVAERMHAVAIKLNDLGRVEFYSLCSSDRERAGVPEAAQRAVEELVYEEALRHLHTSTIYRPVPVCDNCAVVYGYMDGFRRRTKQLKAVADQNIRVARVVLRRQLDREKHRTNSDRYHRPHMPGRLVKQTHTSPLRRYSDLNLVVETSLATEG